LNKKEMPISLFDKISSLSSRPEQINKKDRIAGDTKMLAIDHVAIAVKNIEESLSWYINKLGFSLIERRLTTGKKTSMQSAVLRAGEVIIVLVQGMEPDSQVNRFIDEFGEGVQHVALSVSDIAQAIEKLTAAGGYAETGILQDQGIKQTFLRRDPGSGVRIELIERRGGNFSDDSVQRLYLAMEEQEIY
jgi:methylmalonyl-CoA/ethylmalonyl-CoA epimerase